MRHSTHIWILFLAAFVTTTALSIFLLRFTGEASRFSRGKKSGPPRSIIPLSPALAEIVWDLGLGEKIAAVTDNTRYPELLRTRPKVGGFLTPNVELIVQASPDLVICRKAQSRLSARLRSLGIETLEVADQSIEDVIGSIQRIGKATKTQDRARTLVSRMKRQLDALHRESAGLSKPKVLLVVGRADETLRAIYAAGPKTILGELIRLAGGRNVVTSSLAAYPVVSAEFLESAKPDIIVEINTPPTTLPKAAILASWKRLSQVAQGRTKVVVVRDPSWLIPGPRLLQAAQSLQQLLASLQSKPRPIP